ncbi:MAG TPA: TolC family outer membrane protein [Ideonella sp.]|uniref:TolC family outer membrane protein n=1 Tax=Ideonella sp. TaxID=1929293 RepID=UPI002E338BED|nr:TolC family outer membrane protein [Ideonella sp.]HEX5686503.1 TolC family outer membrane protein [Ideonella sp.]
MTLTRRPTLPRAAGLTPLALALALGFAASAAQAQSLKELYEAARGYDATYLSARALADSAQYRADQAGALRLPTVGLQASSTLLRAEQDAEQTSLRELDSPPAPPNTFVKVTAPSTTETRTTNNQVVLSAQQSLFNRANSVTIEQSERAVTIAQAQLRSAEQDLIVRLSQAYFDVLGAQDTLNTVQASKKAISEQLASAKRNFEVGTATITDTREAQARYDLSLAQELAADNDLRVKRLALDQLVGRSNATPRPLALPVVLPPVAPANVDDWVTGAETRSPTIQQAQLGLEVAKLETEKARAGHLPTLGLGASYTRTYPSGTSETTSNGAFVSSSRAGNSNSAALALTLNVPLFAGFSVQNRIKETLSLEEKARNDLDAARRGVSQGTRTAFYGVQSGQAQVKALEAAESSSKLALEATQLGYKVGVRVNLDVLNAQTQLYTTQRDLAKARYDVIVNSLKLRQVSGQLQPEDLQATDALLAP